MRTETVTRTVFTAAELKQHFPAGFVRALDDYARDECTWADWSDEWNSLQALDDAVRYKRDHRRWYHRDGGLGDTAELTGKRAFAWLENVLLGPLRVPFGYMGAPGPLGVERRKHARYKERPGTVPFAPLTGFYLDDVLIEELRIRFRNGESVGEAMGALGAVTEEVCNREMDYLTSEAAFLERSSEEGWEFTEDGEPT
jgi:hypothetical protein